MSKVIVITGASGGIGGALAMQLGERGARLVLAARRERELNGVALRVRSAPEAPVVLGTPAAESGARVVPVVADVTRREDVERLRDRALQAFGHVDVWINNAGRGISRSVLDLTDQDFDEMMAVNVKSALYGMQAIAPHFMQRGAGHIVNVSSFLSRVPFVSYRSAYNAAKAALNALTSNLRTDLAQSHPGIHVSLVLPGVVTTDFARHALGGTPPMRLGPGTPTQTAEEAAAAIVALIDNPAAEIYTNPSQAPVVQRYFEDVGAFEAQWAKRDRT